MATSAHSPVARRLADGPSQQPAVAAEEGLPLAERVAELHADSFAWSLVCCQGRTTEAEDVLQTVYCKIVDGKARYAGQSALKTWLFAVIRRTAACRARRRALRRFLLEGRWRLRPEPTGASSSPEQEALQGSRAERVRGALLLLSQRQRQMLELVFYHDHTVQEAAQVLGLKLGTARVHYQRGKRSLARHLGEELDHA